MAAKVSECSFPELLQSVVRITIPKVIGLGATGQFLLSIFISKDLSLTLTIVNYLKIQALGHFWVSFTLNCTD